MAADLLEFDIRDYAHTLEPAKRRGKFICPVCGEPKLSISKSGPGFKCFNDCGTKQITKILTAGQRDERSEEQKRQRQEERDREKQNRRNRLLDIDARNLQYSHLIGQLRLSAEHREELEEERGLTFDEITLAYKLGFRSNEPGRTIWNVSKDLAGVRKEGSDFLLCGGRGILIPILDFDGKTQAIKVKTEFRLDANGEKIKVDSDGEELPKYYYLTSANHNGNGPQLKSGLLPLCHWRHPQASGNPTDIFYCEGELKSFIVACQLWKHDKNVLVVGASGGDFTGIEKVAALNGIHYLLPDAGSAVNRNIAKNYLVLREMCPDLIIGEWGQWQSKEFGEDPDDFLVRGGEIGLGEWDEFIALIPPAVEPPPLTEEQQRAQKERDSEWRSQQQNQQRTNWLKLMKYTPTCSVEQQFWDVEYEAGTFTALKGSTGTGKTQLIVGWAQKHDLAIINIGDRNVLMSNTSTRFNEAGVRSYYRHEAEADLMMKDRHCCINMCIDSLASNVDTELARDRDILIDEPVSVLPHLLHSMAPLHRQRAIKAFESVLAVARSVTIADANLNDWVVDAIHQFCPHLRLRKIENTYRSTQSAPITIVTGAIKADGKTASNDKSPIIHAVTLAALDGKKVCVVGDSQKQLEAIDSLLVRAFKERDMKYESLVIDGRNSEGKVEFTKNPNEYLTKFQPQILFLSPTARAGLDISIQSYFEVQYCIFGWVDTDTALQMIFRLRHCPTRIVALPERSCRNVTMFANAHNLTILSQVQNAYIRQIANVNSLTGSDPKDLQAGILQIFTNNRTSWEDTANLFTLKHAYEGHNMQSCLKWRLEDVGHSISEVELESNPIIKDANKSEKEAIITARAEQEFNAPVMPSPTAAREKIQDYNASPEEVASARKTILLHDFPELEQNEAWTPELVKRLEFDHDGWRTQITLFFFLKHPEIAANRGLSYWDKAVYSSETGTYFFPLDKLKDRAVTVWTLTEWGVLDFINSDAEWTADSPEIKKLMKIAGRKDIIAAMHNKSYEKLVKANKGIQILQALLEKVDVDLRHDRRKVNGDIIRFYSIDREKLNAPDRLAVLAAIERKQAEREWHQAFEGVTTPGFFLNCTGGAEQLRKNVKVVTASTPDSTSTSADSYEKIISIVWQYGQTYGAGTVVRIAGADDPYIGLLALTSEEFVAAPGLDILVRFVADGAENFSHWSLEELELVEAITVAPIVAEVIAAESPSLLLSPETRIKAVSRESEYLGWHGQTLDMPGPNDGVMVRFVIGGFEQIGECPTDHLLVVSDGSGYQSTDLAGVGWVDAKAKKAPAATPVPDWGSVDWSQADQAALFDIGQYDRGDNLLGDYGQ